MDKQIFQYVHSLGQKNAPLLKGAFFITKISEWIFMGGYVGMLVFLLLKKSPMLGKCVMIPFALLVVNILLRAAIKRPRPTLGPQEHLQKASYSFPSNHSASAAVIAGVGFTIYPVLGVGLGICAFFTGVSRIVCGFHYPSDVAMGWFLGILFSVTGFYL